MCDKLIDIKYTSGKTILLYPLQEKTLHSSTLPAHAEYHMREYST